MEQKKLPNKGGRKPKQPTHTPLFVHLDDVENAKFLSFLMGQVILSSAFY